MESILFIAGEIAILFAVVLAGYLIILFYRAPGRARWLEGDGASTVVMIVMMAAGIFALAWLVSGLVALNLDPLLSIALAGTIFGLMVWLLWRLLRMRARLDAAAEGRSPFGKGV